MRVFLTSIYTFSALIATGFCLTCDHCLYLHGDSCSGFSDKCKEDEICVTKIENATVGNDVRLSVFKGCERYDPRDGNTTIYYSSDKYIFHFYTKYCNEDNCNRRRIRVPVINMTKNGVECPTCYVTGSFECTETGTMKCVGEQEQCLDFSGIMRRPGLPFEKHATRGCVNAGTCEIGFPALKGNTCLQQNRLICL
ncbi:phospholipase A2 inhibitor and Ly6/PLAUR domain-containing protein-like isoform X1 [Microcaecilia unicolor]|uniref:Phospholipase A2 inhibitor and Ly6/PLAUR domain-containing protein-like isoform X1 n=1 Tax=Microcaecilia unicolor TaxID=1415580 RepID=A0A6P7Z0R5_9AMPH|nr:phospholipase A2 inhibitor and Ly6/PLAUR domain-containing protein-like isoform X1 [Microcaecilia unicolor]